MTPYDAKDLVIGGIGAELEVRKNKNGNGYSICVINSDGKNHFNNQYIATITSISVDTDFRIALCKIYSHLSEPAKHT